MVRNHHGVTLMELIMVVAIVGIVAMIAPQIITQTTRIFVLNRAKLELQREARAATYVITREVRQAMSSTLIIDQGLNQPFYSRIRFSTPRGATVKIEQSGSNLLITRNLVVTNLTKNLGYVSFTFPRSDDMTIVSVSVTLQEQIYNGLFKALHMASERVRVMN